MSHSFSLSGKGRPGHGELGDEVRLDVTAERHAALPTTHDLARDGARLPGERPFRLPDSSNPGIAASSTPARHGPGQRLTSAKGRAGSGGRIDPGRLDLGRVVLALDRL